MCTFCVRIKMCKIQIVQDCPNVAYNLYLFLQRVLVMYFFFNVRDPAFFLTHCPLIGPGWVTEHIAQFLVVDKHQNSVQYRFNTKFIHFPNRTSLYHRFDILYTVLVNFLDIQNMKKLSIRFGEGEYVSKWIRVPGVCDRKLLELLCFYSREICWLLLLSFSYSPQNWVWYTNFNLT